MQHAAVGVRNGSAAAPGRARDWVAGASGRDIVPEACLHVCCCILRCGGGRRRRCLDLGGLVNQGIDGFEGFGRGEDGSRAHCRLRVLLEDQQTKLVAGLAGATVTVSCQPGRDAASRTLQPTQACRKEIGVAVVKRKGDRVFELDAT